MATPVGVLAIIRASRPIFRSKHDKVFFAVHATLSANGLRLLAVGDEQTDNPDEATLSRSDEAPIEGWDTGGVVDTPAPGSPSPTTPGSYSLLYAIDCAPGTATPLPPSSPRRLLAKAVAVGDQLLVSLLADPAPAGSAPCTLELDVEQVVGGGVEPAAAYADMEGLVRRVQQALQAQVGQGAGAGSATCTSAKAGVATTNAGPGQRVDGGEGEGEGGRDPLRDYSQPSGGEGRRWGPRYPGGGRRPLGVGSSDVMPGGLPQMGGMGVGDPFNGSGIGGGGMLMGPSHPTFGGGELPGSAPRPGVPGGIRWDPIAPEGIQGWNPDDFVRGGRGRGRGGDPGFPDPDIMNPNPDNMFG